MSDFPLSFRPELAHSSSRSRRGGSKIVVRRPTSSCKSSTRRYGSSPPRPTSARSTDSFPAFAKFCSLGRDITSTAQSTTLRVWSVSSRFVTHQGAEDRACDDG